MWRAELEAIQIEIPTQGNAERNTSSDKCKAVHKCTGWVDRWLLEPSSKIFFAFPSYCVAVDMKSSSEGGTRFGGHIPPQLWWGRSTLLRASQLASSFRAGVTHSTRPLLDVCSAIPTRRAGLASQITGPRWASFSQLRRPSQASSGRARARFVGYYLWKHARIRQWSSNVVS